MAAAPFAATFKGFVATSVDAAILVSAAMANLLPRVDGHPDSAGYRQLSGSGTVVVFGPRVQRWREGLNWSPRRAIGDGFDVYRQTSKDAAQQLTEAECAQEKGQRAALTPYLGPNVGLKGSKRGGLVKKTIAFTIEGERWGLAAYYSLEDACCGLLPRPRSHAGICQTLVARGLGSVFWGQPTQTARARTVVMADDACPTGTSANWQSWGNPARVPAAQFSPAALPAAAAPFLALPAAPVPAAPVACAVAAAASPFSAGDPLAFSPPVFFTPLAANSPAESLSAPPAGDNVAAPAPSPASNSQPGKGPATGFTTTPSDAFLSDKPGTRSSPSYGDPFLEEQPGFPPLAPAVPVADDGMAQFYLQLDEMAARGELSAAGEGVDVDLGAWLAANVPAGFVETFAPVVEGADSADLDALLDDLLVPGLPAGVEFGGEAVGLPGGFQGPVGGQGVPEADAGMDAMTCALMAARAVLETRCGPEIWEADDDNDADGDFIMDDA